jgi:hypothetical protein
MSFAELVFVLNLYLGKYGLVMFRFIIQLPHDGAIFGSERLCHECSETLLRRLSLFPARVEANWRSE